MLAEGEEKLDWNALHQLIEKGILELMPNKCDTQTDLGVVNGVAGYLYALLLIERKIKESCMIFEVTRNWVLHYAIETTANLIMDCFNERREQQTE